MFACKCGCCLFAPQLPACSAMHYAELMHRQQISREPYNAAASPSTSAVCLQCRLFVCTDIDPNCAECGPGTRCITCAPGFVRGYHPGDTLCRQPIVG